MGRGAQQLQCKSESAQFSEKQQSPCDGGTESQMLEPSGTSGGGGGVCEGGGGLNPSLRMHFKLF